MSEGAAVVGKWLAALTMYAAILFISFLNVTILYMYGKPEIVPILTGFFGLLLQGGALLALGTYLSTTTKNQIVAAFSTFAICLILWVLDWVTAFDASTMNKVISYISVVSHFESFAKGVIDMKDVVYYVSMIVLGLFLTARSMDSMRWRA